MQLDILSKNSWKLGAILIITALACSFWAYKPGLAGDYYLDDIPNIQQNQFIHINSLAPTELWQAMWSGNSSLLKRPIPTLSFALNIYLADDDAFAMKITNLSIHLLCGILVSIFVFLLLSLSRSESTRTKSPLIIAVVVASFWMLLPINTTNVLYLVQRMNSLAGLFTLLSLISYMFFRKNLLIREHIKILPFLSLIFFGVAALLCKENAILIPFYILLIEVFILKFHAATKLHRLLLKYIVYVAALIPFSFAIILLAINSGWLTNTYKMLGFTLYERILTQARVIVWYLKMIVIPNITELSLIHDDISISNSLFNPITTLFSLLSIIFICVCIILYYKKLPILFFGLAWYLTGHLLESTVLPLEMVFEHRNYISSIGIVLGIVYLLDQLIKKSDSLSILFFGLGLFWIISLAITTHTISGNWKNSAVLSLYDAEHHPNSVRANVNAGLTYAHLALNSKTTIASYDHKMLARKYFDQAIRLDENNSAATLGKIIVLSLLKETISDDFIESSSEKLKSSTFSPGIQSALVGLKNCYKSDTCKLTENQFESFYTNALNNPNIASKNRAALLVAFSEYQIDTKRDYIKALNLVDNAILLQPDNVLYYIVKAHYLLRIGDFENTLITINKLKSIDKFGIYSHTTKLFEKKALQHLDT